MIRRNLLTDLVIDYKTYSFECHGQFFKMLFTFWFDEFLRTKLMFPSVKMLTSVTKCHGHFLRKRLMFPSVEMLTWTSARLRNTTAIS